jgi:hypothetical protein
MGTRAAFFVGNPQDLEKREWLGCIAFDGYPAGLEELATVKTEQDFRDFVGSLESRGDFATPKRGWPFPWEDDVFVTDYTYAFFDEALRLTCFHRGWLTWEEEMKHQEEESDIEDSLPTNIPAPKPYDRSQPDSIIIIRGH